jgi:hypothetical protein
MPSAVVTRYSFSPQYQRECEAQKPYPASPANAERFTVSRGVPHGTGVASNSRRSSAPDGHADPFVGPPSRVIGARCWVRR